MSALGTAMDNAAGDNLAASMRAMGEAARDAAAALARATPAQRTDALKRGAQAIRTASNAILDANRHDREATRGEKLSDAMTDRLMLDATRVAAMAKGLDDVAALPDPLGAVLAEWQRPNGLRIQHQPVGH